MSVRKRVSEKQRRILQGKIKSLIPGFEALRQHVVITDSEANILYMNPTAQETTGYSLKEVKGKNPGDLWGGNMPDDFYSDMWETIKQSKKPFMGEVQNTKKSGIEYWQEILISPALDAHGGVEYFIAIEPNITQRKESQKFLDNLTFILTQSKSFSQAIQKTVKVICQYTDWVYGEVWLIDQNNQVLKQDYSWNSRPKKLKQFVKNSRSFTFHSGEGLPGRAWLHKKPEWIPDVSMQPEKIFMRVDQAQRSGLKAAFAQPIIVNNAVVAILAFFMSEARKKDKQMVDFIQSAIKKLEFLFQGKFLEENLNILGQGIQSSKDAIVVTSQDGTILYTNSAWENLVGRAASEVLGKKIQLVWNHGMPKTFFDAMWKMVIQKKKPFSQEVKLISKNRQEQWEDIRVSPIKDETGKVKFLIAIAQDTSNQKTKDQFRDEFISIIGHQLKNPLTSTRWTLELLLGEKKISPAQKKDLEVLYNQNKHILNLVGDLLVLSRVEKAQVKLEKIDLIKELKTILAIAKANHPKVNYHFTPKYPIELETNKTLALQVFYNIIMNAAEYSHQKTGKVRIQVDTKGKQATFTCVDNGIGIPKAEQKRVFTQFFRASNAEKIKTGGTGLGLFIVKLITDTLGWKIKFRSVEGKGTTFTVTFPLE